jgi:hypothetical protein
MVCDSLRSGGAELCVEKLETVFLNNKKCMLLPVVSWRCLPKLIKWLNESF